MIAFICCLGSPNTCNTQHTLTALSHLPSREDNVWGGVPWRQTSVDTNTGKHTHRHLLALPVLPDLDLVEGRRGALGQVLADPVDQELFGRLACPTAGRVVKVPDVLWLVLLGHCKETCGDCEVATVLKSD